MVQQHNKAFSTELKWLHTRNNSDGRKMKHTVIFDLDGTITDPAEGITRSINHALVELGHPTQPKAELEKYIGPHLKVTFSELMQTSDEQLLMHAIELYRERYIPVGYRENRLYDGMREILAKLSAGGSPLCIATAKRKDVAQSVLDVLGIDAFFCQVHGCDLYRAKADLLRDILSDSALSENPMVMIGDRDTDFDAAAEVGMPSIAVRWGYGTKGELSKANATADVPQALPDLIEKTAQPMHRREH
jgi:phosphoglycolate phosphatase